MRKQAMNPFLPLDEYIPDGEPHVFGDRVYLFGSHDKEGGKEYCELGDYIGWSAPVNDLSDWKSEGVIYSVADHPGNGNGRLLYAPDCVQGNDGRFYLYYCMDGFGEPLSVAVSDTPNGRYRYLGFVKNADGTPLQRFIPGDPAVMNDNGTIRLYYGWSLSLVAASAHGNAPQQKLTTLTPEMKAGVLQAETALFHRTKEEILKEDGGSIMGAVVCTLKSDMLTVDTPPKRIIPGQFMSIGTSFEGHAFYEASSIRKIENTYYFIYSSEESNELCYATSKYPDRDFVYRGVIISNGDIGFQGRKAQDRLNMTANNHGSIEKIGHKWYIFYHRQTHSSAFSRQACAEEIKILPDGSIPQIQMTSCGLNGGPLKAEGEYPAPYCCNLTNGHMPHITNRKTEEDIPYITHSGNERYITNIKEGTKIGYKYFSFEGNYTLFLKCRGKGKGFIDVFCDDKKVCEIPVEESAIWKNFKGEFADQGNKALYFVYRGSGAIDLLSLNFEKKEDFEREETK